MLYDLHMLNNHKKYIKIWVFKYNLIIVCTGSNSYLVKTHQESNNYGTWFNWDITLKGEVDDENLYFLCKKFSHDMQEGLVKVEHNGKNDIPF